ncbi:MAG TPA: hypothetical protein VF571_09125 [Pyrinomonadaceae bacterium]|jgi:hypothetical protein
MIEKLHTEPEYWQNMREINLALKINEVIDELNEIKKLIEPTD